MQPTVDIKTVISQLMEVISKYAATSPDVSQNTVTPSHLNADHIHSVLQLTPVGIECRYYASFSRWMPS